MPLTYPTHSRDIPLHDHPSIPEMALQPHEFTSPFFHLPAETRLQIYNYVTPADGRIHVDLCATVKPNVVDFGLRKRSICSSLVEQLQSIHEMVNANGLQLLMVCRRIQSEVFPILSNTTTRFHCHKCFDKLLPQISHGLGVGVEWMRHVEIVLDLSTQLNQDQRLTIEIAKASARETMQLARKKAFEFFGRLDLMGRERWNFQPMEDNGKREEEIAPPFIPAGPQHTLPLHQFNLFGHQHALFGQQHLTQGHQHHMQGHWPVMAMQGMQMGMPPGPGTPHGAALPAMMNGMTLHAMSNGAPVPAKWLISGWFDI